MSPVIQLHPENVAILHSFQMKRSCASIQTSRRSSDAAPQIEQPKHVFDGTGRHAIDLLRSGAREIAVLELRLTRTRIGHRNLELRPVSKSTADPLMRARRFHAIAQENLQLAETARNADARLHYARIAERDLVMAKAELESALRHASPFSLGEAVTTRPPGRAG